MSVLYTKYGLQICRVSVWSLEGLRILEACDKVPHWPVKTAAATCDQSCHDFLRAVTIEGQLFATLASRQDDFLAFSISFNSISRTHTRSQNDISAGEPPAVGLTGPQLCPHPLYCLYGASFAVAQRCSWLTFCRCGKVSQSPRHLPHL